MTVRSSLHWMAVAAGFCLSAAASAQLPLLESQQTVHVRKALDGGGPSHLFVRGRALIVLDANEGLVRRYALDQADAIADTPTACSMPRNFSPRFVQPLANGVRILGEERRPGPVASNANLPALDLTDPVFAAMAPYVVGQRPAQCGPVVEKATSIPVEARATAKGFLVSRVAGTAVTASNGVTVTSDNGAELFNARSVGLADNYGPAVMRREYVGGVRGSVDVALWVTLVRNGHPTSIRILDHSVSSQGEVSGLVKRGFDYVAVAGHSLYVLGSACSYGVCIERYELAGLPAGSGAGNNPVKAIDLTGGDDRYPEDGPLAASSQDGGDGSAPVSPSGDSWQKGLVAAVGHYAFNGWTYPRAGRGVPCASSIPDQCQLRLHDGVLIDAQRAVAGDSQVTQKGDEGDALWIGPRNLIEAAVVSPGNPSGSADETGIPYSFGGETPFTNFDGDLASPTPRPVGHIRELLKGPDSDHYPIGIDCSRFIWRIFGILADTADWIDNPSPTETRAVPDLRDARPGDVIVKRGHIVIYNRRVVSGANRSIEVFEAGSRCGRVCRSVYDSDFFNGWRILRLREMHGKGIPAMANPYWGELDPKK